MRAAAENLTPVTLELGGKSPVIVAPDFPIDVAARRIIWGKCLNAGQTCVAPDYALVPEGKEQQFIDAARDEVHRLYPAGAASPDYSAIINARHFGRLKGYLKDAQAKGAKSVALAEGESETSRKLPRGRNGHWRNRRHANDTGRDLRALAADRALSRFDDMAIFVGNRPRARVSRGGGGAGLASGGSLTIPSRGA